MNIPSIEPIFTNKRTSQMGLSKALSALGFGTWSELETTGIDQKNALSAKDRVNDALNARLAEVEEKREKALLLEKKIGKMADGPERRKLVYRKKQQEEYERKRKKTPVDEERLLHESYQLVLKEFEIRRIRREREMERLGKQSHGSQSVVNEEHQEFMKETNTKQITEAADEDDIIFK